MIQEPLDFKRAVRVIARHKIVVAVAAVLGVVGGAASVILRPPMPTSQAFVLLQPVVRGGLGTQVVIARSDAVLRGALRDLREPTSLRDLQTETDARIRTNTIIAFIARRRTAAAAVDTANALARSYVEYVGRPGNLPDGTVEARIMQPAATATAPKQVPRLVGMGLLGALVAATLAGLGVLGVGRRDRRLRQRDEIADSIGVPVLASTGAARVADAAGWRRLLNEYEPGAADAWRMRKVLQHLGLSESVSTNAHGQNPRLTVTVVSMSVDRKALALGPQLAVFAASRGIPTALVVGPQQDVTATATLRAACAAPLAHATGRLRLVVCDDAAGFQPPDDVLTVVVAIVDRDAPHLIHVSPSAAVAIAVSAGMATADQLAQVAASAAIGGHDIVGILVADPDPADTTTGRLPQVDRPTYDRRPTLATGSINGTKQ